jgi:carbamate kinase
VKSVTVIAIGGNSLIRSKDRSSFADQLVTTADTCRHIADIVEAGHEVVVTHGNGPQVGFILIRSHLARNRLPEVPLDACNAQTQAEIGYMIQQSLDNEFKQRDIRKPVVTLVTQVVVDAVDPAFQHPSKPVGPFYTKGEAAELEKELGWVLREDAGRGFRRLVPSPRPVDVVERPEVESLLRAGAVVVACGGGGIPVIRQDGMLKGVAAVIDKDLASSLLEIGRAHV